jgi:hypothetical protein
MWQVSGLYIGLETSDYLILAYNVVQLLRPVLLDPDLLFDRQPLMDRVRAVRISIFLQRTATP